MSNQTRKLVLTAVFCGIAIATSGVFSIPLGIVRAFPIQHAINVLLVVMVGTKYAVSGAFAVSVIRNIFGLGTIFAFPGSMVGAILAGIIYKKTNNVLLTALGEAFGTGIIGSLISFPIATFIMGRDVTLFFFVPGFLASSLMGAAIGFIVLKLFILRVPFLKNSLEQ